MCGVAGVWTPAGAEDGGLRSTVGVMLDSLRHRGPDDRGIWIDDASGLALGHVRLSIIDLSPRARQPMAGPGGRTRVTFNGEIYNYLERRRELQADGVRFVSDSDTEVLAGLYERRGLGCLPALRGMFAFALWDAGERKLFLARDRLGKKPLYYCRSADGLYFGSEIKAVTAALPVPPTLDESSLAEYLARGYIGGERTIYREIRELPPGSLMVGTSPRTMEVRRYWSPPWIPKRPVRVETAVEEAEALLAESVRIRLRSDVPVGIFLSGGIDSGLVTAMAARHGSGRLRTFTIGFEGSPFDERPLARQVARRYGTEHEEILLRPDVAVLVHRVACQHDEPFADPSAIPTFAVAEAARRHVKVVLNGDGGDELFAGYRRHVAAVWAARLRAVIPDRALAWGSRRALELLPTPRGFRTPYAHGHRFLRGLAERARGSRSVWGEDGFAAGEIGTWLTPFEGAGTAEAGDAPDAADGLGPLDRILADDLFRALPDDLLVKMDIASMAYGLEARSPFLDQDLVDWAVGVPEPIRLKGLLTKPILRRLARRHLPDSVTHAPKRGFEAPVQQWLKKELRELRDDLLLGSDSIVTSLFGRRALNRLVDGTGLDPSRWSRRMWTLLMLAMWDRTRPAAPHCPAAVAAVGRGGEKSP